MALLILVACGDNLHNADGRLRDSILGTDDGSNQDAAPTVTSVLPLDSATGVPLNAGVSATFSSAMDVTTLVAPTLAVATETGSIPVPGTVIATSTTIAFVPTAVLDENTSYVATISTAATSVGGVALAQPFTWTFETGTTTTALGVPVNLGTSGNFVLLAESGITNVPTSAITGDIGVSPITATAITGFPLTPDSSNQFSTTPEVTGHVLAANFAEPTPTKLTAAIGDMTAAFAAAAARAPDVTELGAGTIGSITLAPGVYKWSSGLLIPTNLTLAGSATDVWVFEIAQGLTLSTGTQVFLAGGALPANIFWQVTGEVVVHTGAHLEGNVLTLTAATLDTGASLNGRLLAQTLVTVRGAIVTKP